MSAFAIEPDSRAAPADALLAGLLGQVRFGERELTMLGFSPDVHVFALRARARASDAPIEFDLRRRAGHHRIALARLEADVVGISTGRPADCGDGVVVGVGDLVPVRRVAESFAAATRALHAAWPTEQGGTYELDDVALLAAIAYDDDLGERLERRYLCSAESMGRLGPELEGTLGALLANHLDVSRAAADLDLHPNTLRYRLRQYASAAGVDLCNLHDVIGIWWALKRRQRRRAAELADRF